MSKKTRATGGKPLPLATHIKAMRPYVRLYAEMERIAGLKPGTIMLSDVWATINGHCPMRGDAEKTPLGQAAAFARLIADTWNTERSEAKMTRLFLPLCEQTP